MKPTFTLLALLGAATLAMPRAQAQCHFAFTPALYSHGCCHHRDSCAVRKPYVPGRLAGYMGLLGAAAVSGTPYVGGDVEAYYWALPRWSTGLRATGTAQMPTRPAAELNGGLGQPQAADPRLLLYSLTWSNRLLLSDAPRWRVALEAGAGLGGINLYDKARQVQVKGQSCGCTEAEKIASATAPVTEIGLAATYKLKGPDAPWLTVRGGYRSWVGPDFAGFGQPSAYVLSIGVSLPDAPLKRR